jgi:acyl carrier protein
METNESRIMKLIESQSGISEQDIKPESRLADDLGFDSLDDLELVMAIEDEFEIDLPDEEIEAAKTVQDVFNVVAKHAGQKAA